MKQTIAGGLICAGLITSYSCDGKNRNQNIDEGGAENTPVTQQFASNDTTSKKGIKFLRQGGGNLEYTMTINGDSIYAHVTKKQFKETDYHVCFGKMELDSTVSNTLEKIIKKEIDLGEEDTTQSPGNFMCGGTWSFAFYIEDTVQTPIYDKALIGIVTQTENHVRDKIEQQENKKSEE